MQSSKKPRPKPVDRVSKSGRIIKTPKSILPTSSDEAPRQRSSKKQVHVRTELQRLREIAKKSMKYKKTSGSGHEVLAPPVIKEGSQGLSSMSVDISTTIGQANPNGTENSGNKSPPPGCSGIQISTKKSTNTVTSISQASCRGISPSPPRNQLLKVGVNIERETPIADLEENRDKAPKVDLGVVLERLKQIEEQNQDIQLHFEAVEKQNLEIIAQQKQILESIGQRNIGEEVSAKLYEPLEGFPLTTIEEFQEIEDNSKRSIRKKLYAHLCNLGGSKVREFLNCALKEVMTDELVNLFTWPGGKKNAKFGDTKVAKILYLAAKNCPLFRGPETVAEFKTEMLEVLRTTKQRFRKLLKKSLATDQVGDADDDVLDDVDDDELNEENDELDEVDDEQLLQKILRLQKRLNIRPEDEDIDREIEEDLDADYETDDS